MDYRLPKSLIITEQRCFQHLFERGRRISGDIGQLIVLPCTTTKVAFVVGKKVGSAVTRSRLRRYLREFFRTHKHLIPKDNAVIFQIFSRQPVHQYSIVESEFVQLCQKL